MKKRTWIFLGLYLLALLAWPGAVFAQNNTAAGGLSLTPPDTDLSVVYLSNIFGVVDGVLSGTGSQLLGAMFGLFNGAVLVLGGIVILYTLFVSTINTAHEGEVMGKNWSSIWIPLRSVIGIALLVPKASGYSFIQIFMMWVTVMGVGAADSVWNSALDYFLRGGILMQQNVDIKSTTGGTALINGSANLLRSLTCTYMLQRQLEEYRNHQINNEKLTNPIDPVPNFYADIMTQINNSADTTGAGNIALPSSNYKTTNGVCGNISWDAPALGNPASIAPQLRQSLQQSRTLAVQSMVTKLYGTGQAIVNNALLSDPKNRLELGHILNPGPPMIWGGGSFNQPTRYLLGGSTLSDATTGYLGIMAPTLNYMQNATKFKDLAGAWVNNAKQQGWILAGRYYYDVIELNKGATLKEGKPPNFTPPPTSLNTNSNIAGLFTDPAYAIKLDNLVNGTANYQTGSNSAFIKDAITYGQSLTYGQINTTLPSNNQAITNDNVAKQVLGALTFGIGPIIAGFADLGNAQGLTVNPILALATLGSGLISASFSILLTIAILVSVATAALGAAWGFTFSVAVIPLTIFLSGVIVPLLIALMITGMTMAFYIPIIPFVIFTFAAIGWFISVIEAIIAAPLVALGIAHPEGQAVLGKAEPAVILLVNVFLRPTFMVFGMLIGIMLSYVGIWLLNKGFNVTYASAVTPNISGLTWIFYPLAMLCIYTLLVMQIVQKSFTLIHVIPDEVLKWIGGNIRGMGGEAEAERAVSGGFGSAAEKQGSATGNAPKTVVDSDSQKANIQERIDAMKENPNQTVTGNTPTPPNNNGGTAGQPGSDGSNGTPPGGSGGTALKGGDEGGGMGSGNTAGKNSNNKDNN